MSNSPYGPVADPDPWLSHVDRINPGVNAADIPGQGIVVAQAPAHSQETEMPTDDSVMRDRALELAAHAGVCAEDVVAMAQLFLAFLRGQADVPAPVPVPDLSGDLVELHDVVAMLGRRVADLQAAGVPVGPPPPVEEAHSEQPGGASGPDPEAPSETTDHTEGASE